MQNGLVSDKPNYKTIGNLYPAKRSLLLFPLGFHLHVFFLILRHLDERRHSHSIKLTESLQTIVSTNPVMDSKH